MRNIPVSVHDDTYRRSRIRAAELDTSVSALVRGFLEGLVGFRNQIPRLSKANALGTLIERLTSPDVNLSPAPVKHTDGSVRHPGIDNQGIGSYQTDSVKVGYEISFTRYFYVDAILLLRSFYKSGRWNCLQRMAMTPVGVSA